MIQFFKTIIDDDLFDAKYKTPKSTVDTENGVIALRDMSYPTKKDCQEFIVSGDTIIVNIVKRRGVIAGETFYISQVSNIALKMKGSFMGHLEIEGRNSKKWFRFVQFNISDVFVAHAVYAHVVILRQKDMQNSLKHSLDPQIASWVQEIMDGQVEKHRLEEMRRMGMWFPEPVVNTIAPAPPTQEVPAPQTPPAQSVAEELWKLKQLVDMGVLTQEEFEHKKKKLLGM